VLSRLPCNFLVVQCRHYSREENVRVHSKRNATLPIWQNPNANMRFCTNLSLSYPKNKKRHVDDSALVSYTDRCAVHKRWYRRVDPFHLHLRRQCHVSSASVCTVHPGTVLLADSCFLINPPDPLKPSISCCCGDHVAQPYGPKIVQPYISDESCA
jgi:hypothetical protein